MWINKHSSRHPCAGAMHDSCLLARLTQYHQCQGYMWTRNAFAISFLLRTVIVTAKPSPTTAARDRPQPHSDEDILSIWPQPCTVINCTEPGRPSSLS